MDELIAQISAFAKGAWKHRWWGLLAAWVVAIIGSAAILRIPDKYEASARVFVDTQSILKPLMSGLAVQPNVSQQVTMLSRTLISRPNVEKLIRMADLDLASQSPSAREALIDSMMSTLQIQSAGRDNLYTITYRDPVPQKAQRVVQSLVSIFVESSLGDSRKDTEAAQKFIADQIKTYETRLEEAETRLKEFRLRNIEMQSAAGPDVAGRIGELGSQYNQARLELLEAERARDAAKRQLDAERALITSASSKAAGDASKLFPTPEIDARLDAQRKNLDALLQRFTDQHPDVISGRRLVKELEEQKRKEVEELRKSAVANPTHITNSSPVMQELGKLLAAAEVQVASLTARVNEYASRYERGREMVKTAPQVEAEFAQLNRDYAINKKNYEDLVARRESASLTGSLDSVAGVADFRLIDPPRVSQQPVAPNRSLLLIGAMFGAIVAGIGVAVALSQLRPVFHDARTLRSVVGLPLLGVVTLVVSDAVKKKERSNLLKFALASGSLVMCFAVGISLMIVMTGRMG
ncbi:XrtA system polysaccharide chain length determinant [Pseudorhodoferax sp. Leaf267]|uniref:XrtA system polysaccharide chain length determinant n=1 Tax=Pseudorhodoferax sp. Leaf267 TaxID=1736316 RepID=UPI0006F3125D|nr:XrtA system polysaccharide chain length determinant [Pseudorhodoferax sp. Leaf267]KQP23161.1 chain length-determining protein [Pseudorhodoferax sp. Leaf267]